MVIVPAFNYFNSIKAMAEKSYPQAGCVSFVDIGIMDI